MAEGQTFLELITARRGREERLFAFDPERNPTDAKELNVDPGMWM